MAPILERGLNILAGELPTPPALQLLEAEQRAERRGDQSRLSSS